MLFGFLKKQREKLRYYDTVTGMNKILRRYFVLNSFDGSLTIFGLLLGAFIAGVSDIHLIIRIALSTALAIGFSGLMGAMMTEKAERARELKAMERALNRKLDNTDYKKAYDFATLMTAIVDGFSPLVASLVLLSPFFLVALPQAYLYSFGLAMVVFFLLGMFLGEISRESVFFTGMKFLLLGLFCMAVILLTERF
jgi:predicted membrane protein (TIGR00267 family)